MTKADILQTRRGAVLVTIGIGLLFLAFRVALLVARDPFFDELFTRWISRKPLGAILDALRYDSGPPLYYFAVHLARATSVTAARAVSLVCSCVTFLAIALSRRLGSARFLALALLAVFPPAMLFAADARAYAMCAMFVTLGILALVSERPWWAAAAFVLAAYSHYYGVLFFPLLLPRYWRQLLVTLALFGPGFWLAIHQPKEATQWLSSVHYPEALLMAPPKIVTAIAAALAVIAAVRLNRFAVMTLVPAGVAIAFLLIGRNVYFPLRFESVIAVPLVLWLATSLHDSPRAVRVPVAMGLLAMGALVSYFGIVEHARRPLDDYRSTALWVRHANDRIVASGFLYLELVDLGVQPIAFPPEQALHPGWRAVAQSADGLPQGMFLWVGERTAPERRLVERFPHARLYETESAAVLRVLKR